MKPKVLYLPLNSQEVKQTGMYDAFRKAGVDLHIFDFNLMHIKKTSVAEIRNAFVHEARVFQPHLIHMQLQFTTIIDYPTLIKVKEALPNTIITNWTGDVRKNVPKAFIDSSKAVDISLISSTGQLPMYKKALNGRDVRYWQIGFDPNQYYPMNKKVFKYNTVFAASNHTRSGFPGQPARKTTADLLRQHFGQKFGLFGYGWRRNQAKYMYQSKLNALYNDSASCISVSNFNDLGHYFSDRLLMCMASGRPTVSFRFPGWQSYFLHNHDIVIANSAAEIPGKVQWLVNNPEIATAIGKAGAEKVYAEHSYYCRAKELLHMTGLEDR